MYSILPKESLFWPTFILNWVKTKILKFNRPVVNSICNDHHSKAVKLFTWLKLALSHLQKSKFKHSYPFFNKDHNHIITDKLEVISQKRSCKRFSKDPKYWQNRTGDCEKAKENIITGTESCIQLWCDELACTTSSFSEWKKSSDTSKW